MCDFCDGKKAILNEGITLSNYYVNIYYYANHGGIRFFPSRKRLEFDNSGCEYARGNMLINYCPICGKDLREGEDKVD